MLIAYTFDQISYLISQSKMPRNDIRSKLSFFLVSGFIWWRLQAHVAESQWQVPEYQFLKWFFETKCSDVGVMNEYVVLNDY